jgi:hypothetical protein
VTAPPPLTADEAGCLAVAALVLEDVGRVLDQVTDPRPADEEMRARVALLNPLRGQCHLAAWCIRQALPASIIDDAAHSRASRQAAVATAAVPAAADA